LFGLFKNKVKESREYFGKLNRKAENKLREEVLKKGYHYNLLKLAFRSKNEGLI
jgi:hypothetical protein